MEIFTRAMTMEKSDRSEGTQDLSAKADLVQQAFAADGGERHHEPPRLKRSTLGRQGVFLMPRLRRPE